MPSAQATQPNEFWVALTIGYIPGHLAISVNEAADHLAGISVPCGKIHCYPSDLTNSLKEIHKQMDENSIMFFSVTDKGITE